VFDVRRSVFSFPVLSAPFAHRFNSSTLHRFNDSRVTIAVAPSSRCLALSFAKRAAAVGPPRNYIEIPLQVQAA